MEVTLFFINTLDNQLKLFQHLLITFSFNHFFSGLGFYSLTIKIKTSHEIMRTDAEVSFKTHIFTTQDEKTTRVAKQISCVHPVNRSKQRERYSIS